MRLEKFIDQVNFFEKFAQRAPRAYRGYVGLVVGLGYGVLLSLVLGSVTLWVAGAVGIVLIALSGKGSAVVWYGTALLIGLGVVIVALFRALWLRFDPPEGLKLERHEVPELFSLLDTLSRELKATHFDHIVLDQWFGRFRQL